MIEFKNINKKFNNKEVLKDFCIKIKHNELICLAGSSGVGKTTILDILIGKEFPDTGKLLIDGIPINTLSNHQLQFYRRKLGIIFQDFKLIKKKTIYENLSFILEVCEVDKSKIFSKIKQVLQVVGLEEKIGHFPYELSGGEIQRIALARALVHDPKIVIADEPSGSLDQENTEIIVKILKKINSEFGVTVIIATHDTFILDKLNTRTVIIDKGEIVFDDIWEKFKP